MATVIAFLIHDTYVSPTFGASPLVFLFPKPSRYTNLLYAHQILDEAYIVIAKMTLIELS